MKYCIVVHELRKILIIVGPTASGKSALGVILAKKFNGEIISADSRQVYRGLNIGTGKITRKEMKGVLHHLLNVASPKRTFTADDFKRQATKALEDVQGRGKLPVVVGGTGFYIDSLVGRISLPNVPPNRKLREKLQKKSAAQLYATLEKKDPARAHMMISKSERNNKVRLIRALEVVSAYGKVSMWGVVNPTYDVLWVGITPPFTELEKKIAKRLGGRLKKGMVREAQRLHAHGLSYKRMEELGLEYRSLARYLQGEVSKEEMQEELGRDIRRYAKKQLMYWKRNKDIQWFKPNQRESIERIVRTWLKK